MAVYVFSSRLSEAVQFAVAARMPVDTVIRTDVIGLFDLRFNEDDEVFILPETNQELRREIRKAHDKSWPRPHVYKEVTTVGTPT